MVTVPLHKLAAANRDGLAVFAIKVDVHLEDDFISMESFLFLDSDLHHTVCQRKLYCSTDVYLSIRMDR